MKEKVVEILIYLMTAIHDNKRLADIDVDDLRNQGYTQAEISTAFSWLYDNMPGAQGGVPSVGRPSPGSRRQFHDAEKAVLPADGRGYLIQLSELGLIGPHELESIIERVMMSGFEQITLVELKEIVAAVLFSREPGNDRSGRTMLNSGDTIH